MTTYVGTSVVWGACNDSPGIAYSVYRTRMQAIEAAMLAVGMVRTADTGQIDLTTYGGAGVTPSGSADFGPTVYRFNDAGQATQPVYFKIIWGNQAGGRANLRVKVQVGTGTNGASTLTNPSATITCGYADTIGSVAGPIGAVQPYACHVEGYLGVCIGPSNVELVWPLVTFTIARTKDSSGAFDGTGIILFGDGSGPENPASCALAFLRTASPAFVGNASRHYCVAPGIPTSTALLSGDKQLYPHFYADPAVKQAWHQFTVRYNEFAGVPTSFSASPMYSTARTFMCAGAGSCTAEGGNNNFRLAMLWE